ncbi:hypothetical protein [uncultured Clostridium sp.]|uniref:hypothetical protein n=1 Tax=uncultured Clostridium sp. TaxID=59620 RepID=UPI0026350F3A|nr:hypothetical protein [uncultured Clostridium sp.]
MFKFDHFVLNVGSSYQKNQDVINNMPQAGFPYKPSLGKGSKEFNLSNLWIGNEYLEMVHLLSPEGNGWKKDWIQFFNSGHRGVICIMLQALDIHKLYSDLRKENVLITFPEAPNLKFFFNLFTKTMPWKNSYISFFEGIPLQIGFQQVKDEHTRKHIEKYMKPNIFENDILNINKAIVRGPLTSDDFLLIKAVFHEHITNFAPLTIALDNNQSLIFEKSPIYEVHLFTTCENELYLNKSVSIENLTLSNSI